MPLSLRPLLRARAAFRESTLAPELVLLCREAAGEADSEANWVKIEKTVFQASEFLGLGALWQSMPSGPTAWASLLFGLRASGIGKGVLTLPPGLSELMFLRFVPSGWG